MAQFPVPCSSTLAFLIFLALSPLSSQSCPLVPNTSASCMDLVATPFITFSNSQFGPFIEGAGVNGFGQIFATDYGNNCAYELGQVYPGNQHLFYSDWNHSSCLNAIRFCNKNTAFVCDTINHRVIRLDLSVDPLTNLTTVIDSSTHCQSPDMLEPNDVTVSRTGTIFTSGMRKRREGDNTDGDIWSCLPNGFMQRLEVLGRTNGIDLNPAETKLYVSESYNHDFVPNVQRIWAYDVNPSHGTIQNKALFADFAQIDGTVYADIDGMKTDMAGNLWVSRYGAHEVAVFDEQGNLIGKVATSFPHPTNLDFGGPSGTTLFMVGECKEGGKGCVDTLEVNIPGRSWTNLQCYLS